MNLHIDEVATIADKRFYRSRKWIMPITVISIIIIACLIVAALMTFSFSGAAKTYTSSNGDIVVVDDHKVTLNGYRLAFDSKEGLSPVAFTVLITGLILGLIWLCFFVFLCYQETEHRQKFIQDYYDKGQVLPE